MISNLIFIWLLKLNVWWMILLHTAKAHAQHPMPIKIHKSDANQHLILSTSSWQGTFMKRTRWDFKSKINVFLALVSRSSFSQKEQHVLLKTCGRKTSQQWRLLYALIWVFPLTCQSWEVSVETRITNKSKPAFMTMLVEVISACKQFKWMF